MLTSEPVKVDVPHEKDTWFRLCKLSWKQLRGARKIAEEEQREIAKSFGAEFIAALTKGQVDEARARKLIRDQEYNVTNFDLGTLLESGIVEWSYETPLSLTAIEQLDERTAIWAAQAIIDLTKPPNEEEEKNS